MRATLSIPDELLSEVQKLSGEKTRTRAIVAAMEAFIRQRKKEKLLALRGKVRVDYDWEAEERAEWEAQEKREKSIER